MGKLCIKETQGIDVCPFCGGRATLHKDSWATGKNSYAKRFWVRCKKCGSCSEEYRNEDEAVAAWNRRHQQWHSANQPGQPPVDTPLIVVVSGKPRENITLHHAIQIATWDPSDSAGWIIECWPDWTEAEVSHWMLLPDLPEEDQ